MVAMKQNQIAPPNRDPFGFLSPAYHPLKRRKVLLHHHNNAITHALLRNWMFKYSLQLKKKTVYCQYNSYGNQPFEMCFLLSELMLKEMLCSFSLASFNTANTHK